jgi:5-methylcytosine-specific restriction endonuclease McrA
MKNASHNAIDLTGQVFGRLVVIERGELTASKGRKWICECACGTRKSVLTGNLRSGRQQSCGCLNQELRQARNEARKTSEARKRDLHKARMRKYNATARAKAGKKKYVEANKEEHYRRTRDWGLANPDRRRVYVRNRRARIKGAGSHSFEDIQRLEVEQALSCAGCSADISHGYEVDHVHPLSAGGSNTQENLQLLCRECNRAKSDKSLLLFLEQRHGWGGYLGVAHPAAYFALAGEAAQVSRGEAPQGSGAIGPAILPDEAV